LYVTPMAAPTSTLVALVTLSIAVARNRPDDE
jgi:hypothetical protein